MDRFTACDRVPWEAHYGVASAAEEVKAGLPGIAATTQVPPDTIQAAEARCREAFENLKSTARYSRCL